MDSKEATVSTVARQRSHQIRAADLIQQQIPWLTRTREKSWFATSTFVATK